MDPDEELEIECLCMEEMYCPYRIKLVKLWEAYKQLKSNDEFERELRKEER